MLNVKYIRCVLRCWRLKYSFFFSFEMSKGVYQHEFGWRNSNSFNNLFESTRLDNWTLDFVYAYWTVGIHFLFIIIYQFVRLQNLANIFNQNGAGMFLIVTVEIQLTFKIYEISLINIHRQCTSLAPYAGRSAFGWIFHVPEQNFLDAWW